MCIGLCVCVWHVCGCACVGNFFPGKHLLVSPFFHSGRITDSVFVVERMG